MKKNITHIRITRSASRIKKVEIDDGYGKVIELPITGFEYSHGSQGLGIVKIGVMSNRVHFYESDS